MYSFGEKKREKNKAGQEVDVWVLPKYTESKKKAIEIIDKYEDISEADFWILKNETKTGIVMYSGLIISHNGCLKINETLDKEMRFRPECVKEDKEGYGQSLVYTYCCPEQGIFEVGEASAKNCKNPYPYAMALKRCFDRVVLKASKLAFSGIYSEVESDTFTRQENPSDAKIAASDNIPKELQKKISATHILALNEMLDETNSDRSMFLSYYGVKSIDQLTEAEYGDALNVLAKKKGKK